MKVRPALIIALMSATHAAATPSLIFLPSQTIFSPQAVGAAGPAKNVTIQLSQTGQLTVTGTTASPGFSAPNSCGGDLPPGILCPIPVNFVAPSPGPLQGSVSVSYTSSAAATQSAQLCGTGLPPPGDFTVGFVFDCFANTTGTSAVFNLAVYPNVFNGTVNLSCTTAPSSVPCSVSPGTVTLSGSTAANVTVTTSSPVSSARPVFRTPRDALAVLSVSIIALITGISRGSRRTAQLALFAIMAVIFVGCGSSSSKITVPTVTTVTITAAGSNGNSHLSSLNLSSP